MCHTLRLVVDAGDGPGQLSSSGAGQPVTVSPTLLSAVETVHATTVHKSQGSQFTSAACCCPRSPPRS